MDSTTNNSPQVLEPAARIQAISSIKVAPPQHQVPILPDEPLVTIEPSKAWAINFRALWDYRELLYFLIWRDLKVRFKQTVLGLVWVVMQPLLTTLVFTLFLGKLAGVPSNGVPYPLFVFAGLSLWTFFSGALSSASNSLVGNAHLITKVYFPRMIIPGAALGARLVDFAISFVVLVGLMIYYDITVTWSILVFPLFVALIVLLALGLGMLMSALNVKYRDVGIVLPVLIQLWMFVSPILYPSSFIPEEFRWIYALNPMTGIIENFRASLFGQALNWPALAISTVFTTALLVYSNYSFQRMEKRFADLV